MKNESGFAYVDALVATAVLLVCLIPALEALQASIKTQQSAREMLDAHYRVSDKLELVLARSPEQWVLDVLASGGYQNPSTDLSDATGTLQRRLVYIAFYDGDNSDGDMNPFTGGDPDLIWIRVAIEGGDTMQETVVSVL